MASRALLWGGPANQAQRFNYVLAFWSTCTRLNSTVRPILYSGHQWATIARSWWKQSLKPMQVSRETVGVQVDQVLKQRHSTIQNSVLVKVSLKFFAAQVVSVLPWSQQRGRSRANDIGMEVDRKLGRSKTNCCLRFSR